MRKAYIFKTDIDIDLLKESLETYFSSLGLNVSTGGESNEFILSSGPQYDLPDEITVSLGYKKPGKLMIRADYVGDILDAKMATLKIINNMKKIVKRIINTGTVPTESLIPGHKMPTKSCKKCGQTLQEDWIICPNCGAQIEIEKPVLVCPNCNRKIEKSWNICPYCGEKLREMLEEQEYEEEEEEEEEEDEEEEEEEEEQEYEEEGEYCSYCGAKVPEGARYCVNCGREL